jgi:opacity protein-like surface antigen
MKMSMRNIRASVAAGWALATMMSALVVVAAASAAQQVAPVNVEPPTITGTARVGEALTAQNGTWENSPTEFRYRWLRCNRGGNSCALLAADGKTYTVGQADVGSTLRVRVAAVNVDGSRVLVRSRPMSSARTRLRSTTRRGRRSRAKLGSARSSRQARGAGAGTRRPSTSSGSAVTSTRSRAPTSSEQPAGRME